MENDFERSNDPAGPRDPMGRTPGDEVYNPAPGGRSIETGRTDRSEDLEQEVGEAPPSM